MRFITELRFKSKKMTDFVKLTNQEQLDIIAQIAEKTPRDKNSEGCFFEGDIEIEGKKTPCKGYISPDGKVLRFQIGESDIFQSLSPTAALGFSLGGAAPDWAKM